MSDYMKTYGLGREYAPDDRDRGYPIRATLAAATEPLKLTGSRYWWANGWWGDQGNLPHCVAFSWVHWLEDGPVTWHPRAIGSPTPFNTTSIYNHAQKVDEWPGEAYAGTSVRAGAKVLQASGLIDEYRWAFNLNDIVQTLLNVGPLVFGSNWYSSMFAPDRSGKLNIGGGIAGGHAYVLDGINVKNQLVRMKNSWGRSWGRKGFAYLDFDDVERLLNEQGEACLAGEVQT